MHPDIHKVTKVELHYLPTCPCQECVAERLRRHPPRPNREPHPHIQSMSVETAHTLGFLKSRCSEGSYARKLMTKSS